MGLTRPGLRVLACLALAFVISMFYRGANGVIAPELMAELHIDPATMGAITGAFFFTFAVALTPVGMALDRFGARLTVSALSVVAVAGTVIFATSSTPLWLGVGRAVLGLGCAASLMASITTMSRWTTNDRLAQVGGVISALGAVGALLATAPFAWLVGAIGWRNAFFVLAGVGALIGILVFVGVRDTPDGQRLESSHETPRQILTGVLEVLRHKAVPGMIALQLVAYPSVLTITGLWGGPYLNDVFGLGPVARGNVLLVMIAVGALGSLVIGSLDRRFNTRKGVIIGCGLVSLVALIPLSLFSHLSLAVAAALLVLMGCTTGYVTLIHTHIRSLYPDRLAGRGLSTLNTAVMMGGFLLQTATGFIIGHYRDANGIAPAIAYQLTFAFIGLCLALGLLIYWRRVPDVPPHPHRQ